MTVVINTVIGSNKGAPRIWFQGRKLSRYCIAKGDRYDRFDDRNKGTMELRFKETGKYVVSGRKKANDYISPIIDLNSSEISKVYGDAKMVRVVIRKGRILISVHSIEKKRLERNSRAMKALALKQPLKMASACTGAGILDLSIKDGLSRSGISVEHSLIVEKEAKYLDVLLERNSTLVNDDTIIVESLMECVEFRQEFNVDIFAAGLSCVGASVAGRAKKSLKYAESDKGAGALFLSYLEYIKHLNPWVAKLENVVAYESTVGFEVIRKVLDDLGYDVIYRTVDGNDFGALEKRRRLVMFAISKGLNLDFDLFDIVPLRQKEVKIEDVLEPYSETKHLFQQFEYLDEKEKRDAAQGKSFKQQIKDSNDTSVPTFTAGYQKNRSTDGKLAHPTDRSLKRMFTVLEQARMMTIPYELVKGSSLTLAREVMGQSVTKIAMEAIWKAFGDSLMRKELELSL